LRKNEAGKLSTSFKESHSKTVFHKQLARKMFIQESCKNCFGQGCEEHKSNTFSFLLLLTECKTYRESEGEVLIADLGIAGN